MAKSTSRHVVAERAVVTAITPVRHRRLPATTQATSKKGATTTGKKEKRHNIAFTESANKEIEKLAEELHLRTKGDAVRKGIAILRLLVDERSKGSRILIETKNGSLREIIAV